MGERNRLIEDSVHVANDTRSDNTGQDIQKKEQLKTAAIEIDLDILNMYISIDGLTYYHSPFGRSDIYFTGKL